MGRYSHFKLLWEVTEWNKIKKKKNPIKTYIIYYTNMKQFKTKQKKKKYQIVCQALAFSLSLKEIVVKG